MPIGAILGAGSAIIGASSSRKAAKAQERQANADRAYQEKVRVQNVALQQQNLSQSLASQGQARDQSVNVLDPFYQGGKTANDAYLFELGIGNRPGGYGGFTATPSYDFRLKEGQGAVNALAGARGGLNSGRTLQDLTTFNQDVASQEYDGFLGRLGGMANTGYNAALSLGNVYGNYANGVQNAYGNFTAGTTNANNNAGVAASNAYTAIGNAQSARAIGVGNALNSGIQNYVGYQQYQQGLGGQRNGIGTPGMTYGTPYGAGMSGSQLLPRF